MTTATVRIDTPEYRRWYERGWRYSRTSMSASLDHGDGLGAPDAWYDGYLDAAAGREKWHRLHCADHEKCP